MGIKVLQFVVFVIFAIFALLLPGSWIYVVMTLVGPFVAGAFLKLANRWFTVAHEDASLFIHVAIVTAMPAAGFGARCWKGPGGLQYLMAWLDQHLWTALMPAALPVVFLICLVLPAAISYLLGLSAGNALFGNSSAGPASPLPHDPVKPATDALPSIENMPS